MAKHGSALMLLLALLTPGTRLAAQECNSRDCPRSDYTRLHYWAPTWFLVRSQIHPSNLDQYPPGPAAGAAPSFEITKYKCRTTPATPSSPYADPASYYGRSAAVPSLPPISPSGQPVAPTPPPSPYANPSSYYGRPIVP